MIIVKISGGLGNQLFQYSFGRALAKQFKTKVKFDFQLDNKLSSFTNRENGLSKLNLQFEEASSDEIKKLKKFKTGILSRIERKIAQKLPFLFRKLIVENVKNNIANKRFSDNTYYDGYWQSEYYFKSVETELKEEIFLKEDLDNEANEILRDIVNSDSVCIHIRRGDYLSINANQSTFCSCSLQYYNQAISLLKKTISNPRFFVFSDDIEWVKEHFSGSDFIIPDIKNKHAEVDFWLMANCKYQIIANSSFSWWAAWLNKNENKFVFAPKEWFVDQQANKRAVEILIPKNWIKI